MGDYIWGLLGVIQGILGDWTAAHVSYRLGLAPGVHLQLH